MQENKKHSLVRMTSGGRAKTAPGADCASELHKFSILNLCKNVDYCLHTTFTLPVSESNSSKTGVPPIEQKRAIV